MIPKLKEEAKEELMEKMKAKQPVSEMLEKLRDGEAAQISQKEPFTALEMSAQEVEAADVIWSRTRDYDLIFAVSNEDSILSNEMMELRKTIEAVGQEADKANKASKKAQKRARNKKKGKAENTGEERSSGEVQKDETAQAAEEAKKKVVDDVQQMQAESSGGWVKKALGAAVGTFIALGGSAFLTSAASAGASTAGGAGAGIGLGAGLGTSSGLGEGSSLSAERAFFLPPADAISVYSAEVEAYVDYLMSRELAKTVAQTSIRAEAQVAEAELVGPLMRRGLVTVQRRSSDADLGFKRAALRPFVVRAVKVAMEQAMESSRRHMEL
ncbi:hypothetical protein HRG_003731 [Hirsutella rhossiliensis]|uniref:Uncharacterized protein n=1 Tax=Hirsutella rhossiliensis TaxID=111463 RepID=A0A9P8N2J7_9HYPO|nr:uncharacterized protein HRG_03731 [Hirsutella rhossiliensis]KAH0965715.1 hypothetical protein HRG_03731 [Hirsutella rhossiliensis]